MNNHGSTTSQDEQRHEILLRKSEVFLFICNLQGLEHIIWKHRAKISEWIQEAKDQIQK